MLSAPLALGQRTVTLDRPDATLTAEFTQVRGVRELRDSRIIVSDRLDQGVVVADFSRQAVTRIGRTGPGPEEYRQPGALFPLPGDSTLLVDEGNSRVAIIGPDARIHRSFTMMLPGFGMPMASRGVDARGRYYVALPWWHNPAGADSLAIVRFDARANRIDTVVQIKGLTRRGSSRELGLPYVLFAPQDVWGVAPDGRIAIARARDYHVEWAGGSGATVRGPAVPFERPPVTFDDRLDHVRVFSQNSATGGRDNGTGNGTPPAVAQAMEDSIQRAIVERQPFAPTHPPFTATLPFVAPDGTFWVERSARPRQPVAWDVFDGSGALTLRVTLPRDRRLAGVGARHVYLIATDDDGLQRLERYRRP